MSPCNHIFGLLGIGKDLLLISYLFLIAYLDLSSMYSADLDFSMFDVNDGPNS